MGKKKDKGDKELDCDEWCDQTVVELESPCVAFILAIFNFIPFTSGLGTLISSCCHKKGCRGPAAFAGFYQAATAIIIVGWIWSMYHGCWLVKAAKD